MRPSPLLVLVLMLAAQTRASPVPDAFVEIREVIPDVIVDIRYHTEHNFLGAAVDGYEAPKCYLTRQAVEALAGVQTDLAPFGFGIKVYDCFRPQRAVDHFVRWARDVNDTVARTAFYPTQDKRHLFRDGYIAERSGHSRGSTVDLTIVELPAAEQPAFRPGQTLQRECFLPSEERFPDNGIDMGTGFDCFHEQSHTASPLVGREQRLNRLLLKTSMEKHGFRNYAREWWHFTLVDEPFPDTYFDFLVR
jgi:zinc D-Ala-D-Ala dipeptidase